jgi:hypothetical protein
MLADLKKFERLSLIRTNLGILDHQVRFVRQHRVAGEILPGAGEIEGLDGVPD